MNPKYASRVASLLRNYDPALKRQGFELLLALPILANQVPMIDIVFPDRINSRRLPCMVRRCTTPTCVVRTSAVRISACPPGSPAGPGEW